MQQRDDPASHAENPLSRVLGDQARCVALIGATDAIVWTIHPQHGFVEAQPSWQSYTGQSWQEAQGDGWTKAVHPGDLPGVLHAWTLAVKQSQKYFASCRIWHAESREYRNCVIRASAILDAAGQVVEWVGAVTDVHDRPLNLAEMHRLNDALKQQLEAHHQELERLFSVSLDVMLTLGSDGRLLTVSPSFESVTGVSNIDARGQVFERFVHPEDIGRTWEEVRRVLTGTYNAVDFETRLLHRDGTERIVAWRAVGSVSESRLYAVGRDITEQKRAAERLVRAQRLEAVGQLTGGIAHDFNNILAAMMSYLAVARRLAGDPERLGRTLEAALDAGRRGAALVNQLLTFARKQELALGPVDVNALVEDMRELIERTLGGTVKVRLELEQDLYHALADGTQLESILLNLCINARDALPEGGTLTIRTSRYEITGDPGSRIDDLPRGRYIKLAVIDSGVGMDEAILARCFEPFFTTKGPGQGTGLGLAQVLGIVQQLGGSVHIRSQPGAGTTVEMLLPKAMLQEAAIGKQTDTDTESAPPSLEVGTVLVVDDDRDVLHSTATLLEAYGFDAIPALGPNEAMAVVLSGRSFDVLLTDYAMPEMTGAALVRDALRNRPKLVAIIATGYANFNAIREQLPAVTVLKKPFEPQQLVEAIESAISAHRLQTGEH